MHWETVSPDLTAGGAASEPDATIGRRAEARRRTGDQLAGVFAEGREDSFGRERTMA